VPVGESRGSGNGENLNRGARGWLKGGLREHRCGGSSRFSLLKSNPGLRKKGQFLVGWDMSG